MRYGSGFWRLKRAHRRPVVSRRQSIVRERAILSIACVVIDFTSGCGVGAVLAV
jgi:hypothetical protein